MRFPFGLSCVPLKCEGGPIHPEDPNFWFTSREDFIKRGKAYCDHLELNISTEQIENYYDEVYVD